MMKPLLIALAVATVVGCKRDDPQEAVVPNVDKAAKVDCKRDDPQEAIVPVVDKTAKVDCTKDGSQKTIVAKVDMAAKVDLRGIPKNWKADVAKALRRIPIPQIEQRVFASPEHSPVLTGGPGFITFNLYEDGPDIYHRLGTYKLSRDGKLYEGKMLFEDDGWAPLPALNSAMRVPPGFKAKDGRHNKTGWAKEIVHEKTGMVMMFIPAGEFMRGSPVGEEGRRDNEGPQRRVRITKGFYLGKYEVTQGEWQKVMGQNPSKFKGSDRLPVEMVSWNDCQSFLGKAGGGLRLPTEAEWEYACRAGTATRFNSGQRISTAQVNFSGICPGHRGPSPDKTAVVGSYSVNGWGLYDMHGNVSEWCSDRYGADYYGKSPVNDPKGPADGERRVYRGGTWSSHPWHCRSAYRSGESPDCRDNDYGFRCALDLD